MCDQCRRLDGVAQVLREMGWAQFRMAMQYQHEGRSNPALVGKWGESRRIGHRLARALR